MNADKKNQLKKSCLFLTSLLVAVGTANAGVVKALTFNLISDPSIDANALAGFQEATNIWSNAFTDNVTINLEIGYENLGSSGILAQAGSRTRVFSYSDVRTALTNDASSGDDALSVANLPSLGSSFSFVGTEDDGSFELIDGYDRNTNSVTSSDDNTFMDVNRANAKAIGLISPSDPGIDASITFNSNFNFDLDRSNGISSGQYDFVGIALHEIGHSLGFVSGVDAVDGNAAGEFNSLNNGVPFDLDEFAVFSPLDLHRYSDLSVAVGDDAGIPLLDLSVEGKDSGVNEVITYDGIDYDAEPYLSIDGGANELFTDGVDGLFSTGGNFGDGWQASHWKDNRGIGLLDPTAIAGTQLDLTDADLRAFDIIGYNLAGSASVPFEFSPGLGLLLAGSGFTYLKLRKRQQRKL